MKRLLAATAVLLAFDGQAQDLLETYHLALKNAPEYRGAEFRQLAADEYKSQSIAQMLPKISMGAISSRDRLEVQKLSFMGTGVQNYWNHRLQVDMVQPIFNWSHWVGLDQSENRIAQAEAEYQGVYQALVAKTVAAYFDVLSAQDNLAFAVAEKKSIAKQLEQAKQMFEVGAIAMTDVYEAQAGYDQVVASEIEAQNLLDNAKERLREIIGDSEVDLNKLIGKIELTPPLPNNIDEWAKSAESGNFNIIAQINQAEAVRKAIELQQSRHLPTVDVVASYAAQDNGNAFGLRGDQRSVGLQFNMPIFSGGDVSSKTRQAEYDYEAAKEALTQTKRAVNRQVKDAYRAVSSLIGRVQALEATVKSAEIALEAAEAGFEVGTRTMVDVLAEQRNLYKAKRDYARSRYDYLINSIRLKEATGSLGEADVQALNAYLIPGS